MTETSRPADDDRETTDDDGQVRVWMVERTFSEDSPNILVTVYATLDGQSYLQKERAYNRFGARGAPTVTAALEVEPDRLSAVDEADVDRYRSEARRMRERHDPDDAV